MGKTVLERLEEVLAFMQEGADVAEKVLPDGTPPDMAARAVAVLAGIAAAAVHSHNQVADKPLNLSMLHEIGNV